MVQLTRRHLLTAAGAAAVAAGLSACDSASSSSSDVDDKRAGAMDGFKAGDQFKATEPLTFPIMMLSNQGYPYKADWPFFKELTARTNVTLESTAVPGSDYNQKRSVMVSAGDAPFIIPKTYHPDEEAFIAGGAILAVSDYAALMPHFTEKVARWNLQPNLDQFKAEDGKYYLLPGLHENAWQDYSLAVRTDVMTRLGLTAPRTFDDLTAVLREMKKAHPDVYPISDRWSTPPQPGANNLLNLIATAHDAHAGWGWTPTHWDPAAARFTYSGSTDQYRQTLEYVYQLVKEGLLDPESFTQTDDIARQKFANGKSFVISANAQTLVNEARKDIVKIPGAAVAKMILPIGPAGATLPGTSRLENGIMISKKALESKNFVAMMQFIDWLWYSDAGLMFSKWGIEGQTYSGKVDDGSFKLDPGIKWGGINPGAAKDLQVDYGFSNGVFAYGGSTAMLNSQFSDEEKTFQAEMNKRQVRPVSPPAPLSIEEREQVTLWDSALKDHVFQNTLKFALGQRPLSEWDAYVKELEGKNSTKYLDIVNKAYERYKKAHG
ncbi:ABC transporter substrate-binding protein [Actinoplanes derwentensis]|uniref:Carbohydrate ABC transporter substrate-binding protein, CUT1 family n=1 Tax=Actinoplanes derwentensis TaxID=113562 RepID=A0A1H1YZK4_9ACTN|nr:extracellular solute-binding protein [Actinoplanes derwentensis]GID81343.1 sugar ABC transporter substrate-binding protein [Actinoplanes derwentensis]SDT26376.1 carbohydrate ABC transporter substrate-binding protein, CUT1 family [Actinoplanes derwentensis]